MNGLATVHDDEERPAPRVAPMLPIEGHLVATVRAVEAAKARCEQVLLCCQYAPRNEAQMAAHLQDLQACVANAWTAYANYSEVLNCQGQA